MIWIVPLLMGGAYLLTNKKAKTKAAEIFGPFLHIGPMTQSGIDSIALFRARQKLETSEGRRRDVYTDTRGFLTVGIGHKVLPTDGLKRGDIISDDQIAAFFEKDITRAFNAAKAQAADLKKYTPEFIAALTEVNFQLGTGWKNEFPNTYNLLRKGNAAQAVANLRKSAWAKQTPVRVASFVAAIRDAYGVA